MTARHPAAAAAGALLIVGFMAGCAASPTAVPTATATTSSAPSGDASPTPTHTVDAIVPTCENTSTTEWQESMADQGWVSSTSDDTDGWPFTDFVGGPLAGGIACTWGPADVATDNVVTLAWAPIEASAALATQDQLVAGGYDRIEAPEGVYFAQKGEGYWADADGYGQAYLFTADDVRWAMYRDEIANIKAPDELG